MAKSKFKFRNRRILASAFSALLIIILMMGITATTGINQLSNIFIKAKNKFIPAIEVIEIIEKLYENRLYVEEHILKLDNYQELEINIYKNSKIIDSLLLSYSETYSVYDKKSKGDEFIQFRKQLADYRVLEQKVIVVSKGAKKQEATLLFIGQSSKNFQRLVDPLRKLTDYHTYEGLESYVESAELALQIKTILYVGIILAVLITIILGTIVAINYMSL
jgi:Four helix bundle sensory module for signal transduction